MPYPSVQAALALGFVLVCWCAAALTIGEHLREVRRRRSTLDGPHFGLAAGLSRPARRCRKRRSRPGEAVRGGPTTG